MLIQTKASKNQDPLPKLMTDFHLLEITSWKKSLYWFLTCANKSLDFIALWILHKLLRLWDILRVFSNKTNKTMHDLCLAMHPVCWIIFLFLLLGWINIIDHSFKFIKDYTKFYLPEISSDMFCKFLVSWITWQKKQMTKTGE